MATIWSKLFINDAHARLLKGSPPNSAKHSTPTLFWTQEISLDGPPRGISVGECQAEGIVCFAIHDVEVWLLSLFDGVIYRLRFLSISYCISQTFSWCWLEELLKIHCAMVRLPHQQPRTTLCLLTFYYLVAGQQGRISSQMAFRKFTVTAAIGTSMQPR